MTFKWDEPTYHISFYKEVWTFQVSEHCSQSLRYTAVKDQNYLWGYLTVNSFIYITQRGITNIVLVLSLATLCCIGTKHQAH